MREQAINESVLELTTAHEKTRELPVGSELVIAFALGAGGWYVIVRLVQWAAG